MRSAHSFRLACVALLWLALCQVAGAVAPGTAIAKGPFDTSRVAVAADFASMPILTNSSVAPLVMLAVSRDEQLFIKAYTDYTDLDGDGVIDITYNNNFNYSGYFDANLCYTYAGNQFKASANATSHKCSSAWSGNFLNWAAMSRADVLRFVLYGGYRANGTSAADTDGTSGVTVLERASIPDDLHAWSKIYSDTAAAKVSELTPYSTLTSISLCNATFGDGSSGAPVIRVASGKYPEWAATALRQCTWSGNNGSDPNTPASNTVSPSELTARVQVCDSSATAQYRESFCKQYPGAKNGTPDYKPVGLLQRYGENGQMRFGLVTGSFVAPRSGGVLRRNIGKIAGNDATNDCGTGDEINAKTGVFCTSVSTSTGSVIASLNALRLTQWTDSVNTWNDCNTYGILNRQGTGVASWLNNPGNSNAGSTSTTGSQMCSAWGNPMSEIYAEALRYIAADSAGATAGFNATTSAADLTGLSAPPWQDPYATNPYCASCSIIVLSTGLNSFDSDEVPSIAALGGATGAATSTDKVGDLEKITGNSYFVGRVGLTPKGTALDTSSDLCTGKTVDLLSKARGICPDIPSMEGSYLVAGLAYSARTTDIRPNFKLPDGNDRPQACDQTGANCKPFKNTVKTYAVALSENLPKFQIPVVSNTISFVPMCQANNDGGAAISSGNWRSCYLGSVTIGPKVSSQDSTYVYGRALTADPTTKLYTQGSFSLVWEDSLWGNDHDNDVVSMITYCVGATCKTASKLPIPASKTCFYTGKNYTGTEYCPSVSSLKLSSVGGLDLTIESVRVARGYTVVLNDNTNNSNNGNTLPLDRDDSDLSNNVRGDAANKNTWLNSARYATTTGGTLPRNVAATTYSGYDICWQSTSAICGTDGKPTVGDSEVLVRNETLSAYAGNAMLTGYSTSGSNDDAAPHRLNLRPGGWDNSILTTSIAIPNGWDLPNVTKYTVGTSASGQLQNPLYYAAKYGGFDDAVDDNGNTTTKPCDSTTTPSCKISNWDNRNNNTGASGSDLIPDTFFPVRNPAQLSDRLAEVFNTILARAGSGTAAAVVANNASGEGVVYSAIYQQQVQNKDASKTINWAGNIVTLWTDSNGLLRGANSAGGTPTLGDFSANPIIVYCTDATGASRFKTFGDPTQVPSQINPSDCAGASASDVPAIWSAQNALNDATITSTTITSQRTYATAATPTSKRYIRTWIDANHNGIVDSGEMVDFAWGTGGFSGPTSLATTACGTTKLSDFLKAVFGFTYQFLNTCDPQEAMNLVNWTRGQDSGFKTAAGATDDANWRSRTVTDSTGVSHTYRLGDIVNSTPLAVASPNQAYDRLYNDSSYGTFRTTLQNRRQVVYVGANDGMIHAFNGGFYDASNKRLNTQPSKCTATGCTTNTTYIAHALGAEIWAYVPGNLLPHLRWAADPKYVHNFYVDGSPQVQDVNAFTPDTNCTVDAPSTTSQCHPGGWGTILIVPFRFGGGPLQITMADKTDKTKAAAQNSFPAYVVLDVTNPEAPPVLLAEVTNTQIKTGAACATALLKPAGCALITDVIATYTTSTPTMARFRKFVSTTFTPNKFFLVTGSGTTDNGGGGAAGGRGASSVSARVRAYDLSTLVTNGDAPTTSIDLGSFTDGPTSFLGDLTTVDTNLDGLADTMYFGNSSGAGPSGYGGALWAVTMNNADSSKWSARELLTLNRPLLIRPTVGLNTLSQLEVFFGTGRALTLTDLADTSQQLIAAVVDKGGTLSLSNLKDISNVTATIDSTGATVLSGVKAADGTTAITTEQALQNDINTNYSGWLQKLQNTNAKGQAIAAERVVSSQTLFANVLLTTTYLPGSTSCSDQGSGRLYAQNYATGSTSASFAALLGTVTSGTTTTINKFAPLGSGLPSAPTLHAGAAPDHTLRACIQTSSGAVLCADVKDLNGSNSGEVSWREPIDK